ncbi:hypothetical protein RRG08_061034 [Elysia crispata]|uniref:Uncharacterized protein n=1 Tax=Elysia crispata TaxID=231223 RepID=A0AAE1AW10_9GAST|nr:hypothetical protein RRG08_061034 [Elysia crispata]
MSLPIQVRVTIYGLHKDLSMSLPVQVRVTIYGLHKDLSMSLPVQVRVTIYGLHKDLSMSLTVQVASESTVTWHLEDPESPDLRLSENCDFEYVLVTSDGYMEVAWFNVWTPVRVHQETDVLITWFAG